MASSLSIPKAEAPSVLPHDVTNAANPLLVAMGLPDDVTAAGEIVTGRRERLIAECMGQAGFDYQPETDPEAVQKNATYQNALPENVRGTYLSAYVGDSAGSGCFNQAAARVYILGRFGDQLGPVLNTTLEEPAVQAAAKERADCLSAAGTDPDALPPAPEDVTTLEECNKPLIDAKAVAVRTAALDFLSKNYDAVAAFGQETSTL